MGKRQRVHLYLYDNNNRSNLTLARAVGLLDIKDIVWPGLALKPPEGLPEKRFVRASFLEEDPYVMLNPPSACRVGSGGGDKGVLCQMVPDEALRGVNVTQEQANDQTEYFRCANTSSPHRKTA